MTLQEIHDHITSWPQRAIAIKAGVSKQIIDAAKAAGDSLGDAGKAALADYQHIANEPPELQVVLDKNKLLAITSSLVSIPTPAEDGDE